MFTTDQATALAAFKAASAAHLEMQHEVLAHRAARADFMRTRAEMTATFDRFDTLLNATSV